MMSEEIMLEFLGLLQMKDYLKIFTYHLYFLKIDQDLDILQKYEVDHAFSLRILHQELSHTGK